MPPANGKVVSDNFQDGAGNAPYNLQFRNTTNTPVVFEGIVTGVPYDTIPNLNPGAYKTTGAVPNPNGGYDYKYSGELAPFSNVTITGGLPTPAGVGSASLSIYCDVAPG